MRNVSQAVSAPATSGFGFLDLVKKFRSLDKMAPVLWREVRAESRNPINAWLRMLAPGSLAIVLAVFTVGTDWPGWLVGRFLFNALSQMLLLAIWIIVPAMTADCLSREKREGTLPLLFLTPLSIMDVILAKAANHMLRAVTLVISTIPIVALPFMLGGVTTFQILYVVTNIIGALLVGTAIGIFASSKGGTMIQVMVQAEVYAILFYFVSRMFDVPAFYMLRPVPAVSIAKLLIVISVLYLGGFLALLFASVRRLRKNWMQDPAAPEQPAWTKLFSDSEMWRDIFKWDRGTALDRNPIAWLQEYSWTAKLTKWGWFAVMFLGCVITMGVSPGHESRLVAVLSLGVAFSAVMSFRRERQTGMLEILLVTPISTRKLILGRLWGLCVHFIPGFAMLATFWYFDLVLNQKDYMHNPLRVITPNPLLLLAMMVTGLYVSLWRLNFFFGWVLSWTVAFAVPCALAVFLSNNLNWSASATQKVFSIYEVVLSLGSASLLYENVRSRRFLETTSSPAPT